MLDRMSSLQKLLTSEAKIMGINPGASTALCLGGQTMALNWENELDRRVYFELTGEKMQQDDDFG